MWFRGRPSWETCSRASFPLSQPALLTTILLRAPYLLIKLEGFLLLPLLTSCCLDSGALPSSYYSHFLQCLCTQAYIYIQILSTWPIQIQVTVTLLHNMSIPLMKYSFCMGYFWSLCCTPWHLAEHLMWRVLHDVYIRWMNEWLKKWLSRKAVLLRIFH